jgi:hypothetical protein
MRAAEVLGAVATVALAFIVLSALAGQSPAYGYWREESGRLVQSDFLTLWRSISSLLFGSLFPLFIAFGLVLLTLVLGISALLRRGE